MKFETLKSSYLCPVLLFWILVFSSRTTAVSEDYIPNLKNATYFCHYSSAEEFPVMTMLFRLYPNGETIYSVYAHDNDTFIPLPGCVVQNFTDYFEMTAMVNMTTDNDIQCESETVESGQEWRWYVRTVARKELDSYPDTVYEMNCNAAWAADGTPSLSPIQFVLRNQSAVRPYCLNMASNDGEMIVRLVRTPLLKKSIFLALTFKKTISRTHLSKAMHTLQFDAVVEEKRIPALTFKKTISRTHLNKEMHTLQFEQYGLSLNGFNNSFYKTGLDGVFIDLNSPKFEVNGTVEVPIAQEELKMELVTDSGDVLPDALPSFTQARLQITFVPDPNRRNHIGGVAVKLRGACYASATSNPADSLPTQKFPLTEPDGVPSNGNNLGCPSIYGSFPTAPETGFEEIDTGNSDFVMRTGSFDITFFPGFQVTYYNCPVTFCRDENNYEECSNQCNYTTEHARRRRRQADGFEFGRYEDIRYLQVAVRNSSFTTTTETQTSAGAKKQEEPKDDPLLSVEIIIGIVTLVIVVIIVVITAVVIAVILRKDKAGTIEKKGMAKPKRNTAKRMHKPQPSQTSSDPRY